MGKFMDWLVGPTPRVTSLGEESRSIVDLPWTDPITPFNYGGEVPSSIAQNRALSLAPVYAANRLLAQSISTLPLHAYRRGVDERQPMSTLPQLFDQLVTDGTLVSWLHRCVTSLGLRGNAYGLVVNRDGFGYPTQIEWLDPAKVTTDDRPGETGWLYNGRPVPRDGIVHIPLFPVAGDRCSPSPIGSFARTLGIGLSAQDYAAGWFGAGGFPPGTFKNNAKVVDQEQAEIVKARLVAAQRTRAPLVYGADWDYTAITVPPEEAQFVETMKMTTNQIASIYGIPPEMIGGESGSSMTYANVEQQQINFVMFTLRPWLVILETAFSALLPNRQFVKLNADALIRADLRTRWEVNQIRVNMGAANIDEIRAQEDQPPLPGGQGQSFKSVTDTTTTSAPADQPGGNVVPMRRDAHDQ